MKQQKFTLEQPKCPSIGGWINTLWYIHGGGVLNDSVGKESTYNAEEPVDMGLIPGQGRSTGEGKWQSTPVVSPGKSHEQRGLVGYNPKSCKELAMTEWLHTHTHIPTMIYSSVIKRNELLKSQKTWKELKNILLMKEVNMKSTYNT